MKIDAAGVTVVGTMLKLNSGGAAGSGQGVSIETPAEPLEADTDSAGAAAEPPEAPDEYSPAAMALKNAARDGTAFCKQCVSG